VRLAYLCNLYPAVSHSFVRREIEAVERAGHEVHRFSLRPAREDLRDADDVREATLTEPVLGRGTGRLFGSALLLFVSRPARTFRAFAAALRLSAPGLRSRAWHVAYWLEAAWLVRRLEQLGVEHLHAHFGTNPAAVAAIVRAWGGPPFSFTAHGPDEFDAPMTLALPAKIAAASLVAAISDYGRAQLMRWSEPAQWNKIKVVRCGLGADFLSKPAGPVPRESTEFVCIARLSAQKGLPLLIAASARLMRAGHSFTVTIIGDGELRSSLDADIRGAGLQQHVHLVGVQSSSEIREALARARAFVLPSFAEGLPVVIMEALALARPVIVTAVAGIPELVDSGCGWLIPAGSEDALADAMIEVLEASPDELDRRGHVGRERILRLHDAQTNAALLVQAITSSTRELGK
jgi:glycosyltransferase involved in cell wall biosynthesis